VARLETLLTEEQIQDKVGDLARQIASDYASDTLLLVGVLKGSFVFLADLVRRLGPAIEVDFVQTSSYGDGTDSSGVVQIRKDLDVSIEGRDVLIVEDILDTGLTLSHLRELFGTRRPRSLKVVTLLRKPGAIRHGTQAEYVGFDIPDVFVVGYGLDHAERYRNLPYVAVLHQAV
jgi:hypoxanthine phosphoribosyltransferase